MTDHDWHPTGVKSYAVLKASEPPQYMGFILATYQRQRDQTEEYPDTTLAAELGMRLEDLPRLALCLRPRPDHWEADLRHIAAHVGADLDTLRAIVCAVAGSNA